VTHQVDREQQGAITRTLLYYLNVALAEGCYLRGVLPTPTGARVAVRTSADGTHETLLYEIPDGSIAPGLIPAVLRTVLARTQLYSSDDVDTVMGMTLLRLRPQEIDLDPEPHEDVALGVLRGLSDCTDDETPFLIGFYLQDNNTTLRLYVLDTDHPAVIGVDLSLSHAMTAITASVPTLVRDEERHRPAPDDPHCDVLVDLTHLK
jgi:hypothetical protein